MLICNIGIYYLFKLKQTNIPDVFYAPQRVVHRKLLPFLVRHFVKQLPVLLQCRLHQLLARSFLVSNVPQRLQNLWNDLGEKQEKKGRFRASFVGNVLLLVNKLFVKINSRGIEMQSHIKYDVGNTKL